jgi:predicted transcriptional regulator
MYILRTNQNLEEFICTDTRIISSLYKMKRKSRTISADRKKRILLKCINNSPGIRYRELLRATGFPNGVAAYHLKILEKLKQMKVSRHYRKVTRYYPLNMTVKESRVIEFMKRHMDRRIILFILKHERCKFKDVKRYIKRASSTVSWHLSRLREAGIIAMKHQTYGVNNRTLVTGVMNKVKE